jgi:hypothetical protein
VREIYPALKIFLHADSPKIARTNNFVNRVSGESKKFENYGKDGHENSSGTGLAIERGDGFA